MFTVRNGRRRFLRDAPTDSATPPGAGEGGGSGAVPPVPTPPAPPAPFDPSALAPEVQAYIAQREREADTKARTTTRDNAAAAARAQLLKELGGEGAEKLTPEQLKQQHVTEVQARDARIAELLADKAITNACKANDVKADDDLVSALLARQGKLKGLDPAAPDFDSKVKALVVELVKANPRLKLDTVPAVTPPGGRGPNGTHAAPNGGDGAGQERAGSLAEALTKHYAK